MARSSASKKSNKDDSNSDSEEGENNDPSFLIAENARLNDLLDKCDDVLRKTNKERGSIGLCLERLRRRWLS
jgi:hypothetical protein